MSTQNLSIPTGFYEIGAYKTNIRRIKDGVEELDEFSKMIKERADIEAKYGKYIQTWHEKWYNFVDSKIPPGLIKDTWDHILKEGNEVSKLHIGMKERFGDEIVRTIALYKKENHHSRTFGGESKEIHEISEAFEKAQKQWKKLMQKLESCKKNYFNACRSEKTAQQQLANAQSDSSLSQDATDKLRERMEKLKEEVRKSRDLYEKQVEECDKYRNVYIENMSFVFEKCQQMEMKRMKFAIEMMAGVQCILGELVDSEKMKDLHNSLKSRFNSVGDPQYNGDLKEWSKIHGPEAPSAWPIFEEYTPGMQHISSRPIKNSSGVVLTKRTATISNEFTDAPIVIQKSDISRPLSTISTIERTHLKRESSSGGSSQENQSTLDSKSSKNSEKGLPKVLQNRNFVASPFSDPFPMRTPEASKVGQQQQKQPGKQIEATPTKRLQQKPVSAHSSDSGSFDDTTMDKHHHQQHHNNNNTDNRNNIEEEEEDDDANTYGDFGQLKGPAKALYDYIPIEGDEIELKKGDLLEVLSGPDHLGWCMGRKNNETGLFPASYVTSV
uniref:Uncharacterized protein n=1 Tax=Panagrolaimus superbus TaxID=310955 RepID=A0A914YLI4_9BILA